MEVSKNKSAIYDNKNLDYENFEQKLFKMYKNINLIKVVAF